MKSFRETQPDFGCASGPLDVQRYVVGRLHMPEEAVVVCAAAVVTRVVVI